MMKKKTKENLKKVGIVLLAVGAVGGIIGLSQKAYDYHQADDRVIHPAFEVGGLVTETGAFEDVDTTIYTEKAFDAKGLSIKLDIDAEITYQVFFYDDVDKFISATEVYSTSEVITVPDNANARIEITPVVAPDKNPEKLGYWDTKSLPRQMEIKVDKDQSEVKAPAKSPAAAA